MQTITHKAGSSFEMSASIDTDITGWTVKSQLRKKDGTLVSDLDFTLLTAEEEESTFTFTKKDTSSWKEGTYLNDIQYTKPDGSIVTTETVEVVVTRRVTQ